MKTVFIAGATGYLGGYLCRTYKARGWRVIALVRDAARAEHLTADLLVEAEATRPDTLKGVLHGAEVVVSALGITRQADGVGYWDVDYQANINLLAEAEKCGVRHFGYVHVLNADQMPHVALVAAKSAFVRKLRLSRIASTVIAPSGYFSDLGDFLDMARKGRVWLFGSGAQRLNPIHGADLADAICDAIEQDVRWLDVGGPQVFTQNDLAQMCFEVLEKPARVTHLPDILRRGLLRALPLILPGRFAGPPQFFLTALGMDMVGNPCGTHTLKDHFDQRALDAETQGGFG